MKLTKEEFDRLKNKDKRLFERLFKYYFNDILSFFIVKTRGNKALSEELASRTFYSAYNSLPTLLNSKKIKFWLLSIARRRLQDHLRASHNKEKYSDPDYELGEVLDSKHVDINDILIKREKYLFIREALDGLKENYRDIIVMKFLEEKTLDTIANETGQHIEAVKSLLRRARAALVKEIKKRGGIF